MVLELPAYKWPSLPNALLTARDQGLAFLKTAGTVIMAICVVMWWLSAYPRSGAAGGSRGAARAGVSARRPGRHGRGADRPRPTRSRRRARRPAASPGRLGRAVQPVFAPLGYDWQLTVGVLTSFLAREVFVSTMSVLARRRHARERRGRRRAHPRR